MTKKIIQIKITIFLIIDKKTTQKRKIKTQNKFHILPTKKKKIIT